MFELTSPFRMSSLRDRIDPVPALIAVGLLAAMGVQFLIPIPGVPVGPAIPQARPLAPIPIAPASDYPQVLARPLFTPSRGGSDAAGGAAGAALADYTFAGAIFSQGVGSAILKGPAGVVRSLHVGDTLLGWQVSAVRPDQLVLQRQSEQLVVPVNAPLSTQSGSGQSGAASSGAPRSGAQ
jgi:hypothetical protein